MKLNIFALSFVLLGMLVIAAQAEPEPEPSPEPAKARLAANPKFRAAELRQAADVEAADEDEADDAVGANDTTAPKGDASSGRLFLKKFLLFKNIFGNNNQQPVIPIIITGPTGTAINNPTTTITSTGTIPTATGTFTTTPTTTTSRLRSGSGYNSQDAEVVDEEQEQGDDENEAAAAAAAAEEEVAVMEEQALQQALIAGAQEYTVTDEEIKGTADSKVQSNRVNLRRKGGKKGQKISVRIPPRYRRYFKAGQKVMLNTGNNRPVKRRVVKKRVNGNGNRKNKNRRRVNKNKNKRTRIVAA